MVCKVRRVIQAQKENRDRKENRENLVHRARRVKLEHKVLRDQVGTLRNAV